MRKCKIKVYDYKNVLRGNTDPSIKVYEVEAWCVQGDTGFKAMFLYDRFIVEAEGDDGHWWISSTFDKHWMKEVADMNQAMLAELMVKEIQHASNRRINK